MCLSVQYGTCLGAGVRGNPGKTKPAGLLRAGGRTKGRSEERKPTNKPRWRWYQNAFGLSIGNLRHTIGDMDSIRYSVRRLWQFVLFTFRYYRGLRGFGWKRLPALLRALEAATLNDQHPNAAPGE